MGGGIILEMFSNDLFHPVQLSKTRTYLIYNDIKQRSAVNRKAVCAADIWHVCLINLFKLQVSLQLTSKCLH